jgi:putative transposase
MVIHPKDYPWSSYAANSGARTDPFVSPHAEFTALAPGAYVDLIGAAVEPALLMQIRDATNSGYPLATESFKSALGAVTGRKTGPGLAGRPVRSRTEEKSKSEPDPDLFSGGEVS